MSSHDEPIRKKKPKSKEPIWLLSFSDMTLILMSFFLLIISTMSPNKKKFDNVREGMSKEVVDKINSLKKLSQDLKKLIKDQNLEDKTKVEFDNQGVHLEFKDALLFDTGASNLSSSFYVTTERILKVFTSLKGDFRITVEGHTDDIPIHTDAFRSNWDLSSARAVSVLQVFQKLGIPENKLSIQAYAHTKPIIPTEGLTGSKLHRARQANRRVMVLIE